MTILAEQTATCGFIPRELDALAARIGETNSLISLLTEKLSPLVTPLEQKSEGQEMIQSVDGAKRSKVASLIDDMWAQVTRQNIAIENLITRIDV